MTMPITDAMSKRPPRDTTVAMIIVRLREEVELLRAPTGTAGEEELPVETMTDTPVGSDRLDEVDGEVEDGADCDPEVFDELMSRLAVHKIRVMNPTRNSAEKTDEYTI